VLVYQDNFTCTCGRILLNLNIAVYLMICLTEKIAIYLVAVWPIMYSGCLANL